MSMPPMPPPGICICSSFFFGASGYASLGGDKKAGHGGRILHDLGRVDDALLHEVEILVGLGSPAPS